MEQMNIGAIESNNSQTRDTCVWCDAQTTIVIRPNDVCSCCDSLDWFEKDE